MPAPASPSFPHGTEDRCCFVCEYSSTNPALIGTDDADSFQPRATRLGLVSCFRFRRAGLVFGYQVCGEYADR